MTIWNQLDTILKNEQVQEIEQRVHTVKERALRIKHMAQIDAGLYTG
jgi:hypothetical protein